jgi:hypothetical protein
MPIGPGVFADRYLGIRSPERTLAAHDDIAVRCDREIERAEVGVFNIPGGVELPARTEGQDGVVALAARTDAGSEEESAVLAECIAAWKRDHRGREHGLARSIERRRKGDDGPLGPRSDIIVPVRSEVAVIAPLSPTMRRLPSNARMRFEPLLRKSKAPLTPTPRGSTMRSSSLNGPSACPPSSNASSLP